MTQLASIFRLRRRLAANRLTRVSPRRRKSAGALSLGIIAALLLTGHLAAPALMEPPLDLATPRGLAPEDLPAGAGALEAAFWLTALLAAVLNFRVLELLFRRKDVVALQILPIEPKALFADRTLATITEAVVCAAVASLFFVPLFWHGGTAAALACILMLLGGLLISAAVSLVTMIVATRSLIPDKEGKRTSLAPADAYGGTGQILLYAPALSLGVIVMAALFWKLLLGEPLRLGHLNEPFYIGAAILLATVVASLLYAFRAFVADYYAMAPRFHEADQAEFSAVINYQQSSFTRRRVWEAGLQPATASVFRALTIDDDRRIAGGRIGYAVVLILSAVAMASLELSAMPLWAVALLPALLVSTVVNPWARLFRRADLLDNPAALPIAESQKQKAAVRATIREYLFVAVPYALLAAVILGYFRGLGIETIPIVLLVLGSGPGVAGVVALSRKFGVSDTMLRIVPAIVAAILLAIAVVSLTAAVVASVVFFLVSLALLRQTEQPHAYA